MKHRPAILACSAALLVAACSPPDDDIVEVDTNPPADARVIEISPQRDTSTGGEDGTSVPGTPVSAFEGGAVRSANGELTLTFPPNALAADAELALPFLVEDDRPTLAALAIGGVYRLEPEALSIQLPVQATVRLPDKDILRDSDGFIRLPLLADVSAEAGFAITQLTSNDTETHLEATLDATALDVLALLPDSSLNPAACAGFGLAPSFLTARESADATRWLMAPRFDNASPSAVTLRTLTLSTSGAIAIESGGEGTDINGRPSTTLTHTGAAILGGDSDTLDAAASATAAAFAVTCVGSGAGQAELSLEIAGPDGAASTLRVARLLQCP